MSFFAVLSVASADVSHLRGYQYPKQSYNLGTGSLQLHPSAPQYATPYASGQVNLLDSYAPAPSGSPFGGGAPLSSSHQTLSLSPFLAPSAVSGLHSAQGTLSNANYQGQASTQSYQQPAVQVQYQQPAQYQQASQTHYQHVYDVPQQQHQQTSYQAIREAGVHYNSVKSPQEPIVTKHFYVHAAPEEPDEETGPRFIPLGQSQKTYKIIFIKAPTYSSKSQVIPVLPQNQEKTIIYVLSKKPEFDQTVSLPGPTPTEPSKPEVFFVKYKTQEEADRAQKQIQGNYIYHWNCITFDITFDITHTNLRCKKSANFLTYTLINRKFINKKTSFFVKLTQTTIDAYNHANGDQASVDLRGVFSNAEHTGSSITVGGQESTQQSQYAGVHYLSPDANRRRRFA